MEIGGAQRGIREGFKTPAVRSVYIMATNMAGEVRVCPNRHVVEPTVTQPLTACERFPRQSLQPFRLGS